MSSVIVNSQRAVGERSAAGPEDAAADPTATQAPPRRDGAPVTLLAPDGTRHPDATLDQFAAELTPERLLPLYEDMVTVRRLDIEGVALQRQGQLALWPPLLGQEAAQVGSARALHSDDFVFSSYREHGVAHCRGISMKLLLPMWRGTATSGWDPFKFGMATPNIIIGAQTLHATGYAMGCRMDGVDSAAVAYFGDGATSQGDVNEAMVFAATYRAPVVFFCQNNHWAISEPVSLVAKRPLADRAPGFGVPSIRVDGNDVVAVTAATRWALDRARSGGGPSWIEAVTYRMGPHTTSDDPSRYVDPLEREEWAAKDPIERLERYLSEAGVLDDSRRAQVRGRADATAAAMRAACLSLPDPKPLELFDHVYTEPTPWLRRQRSQYAAYLAMFEEEGTA